MVNLLGGRDADVPCREKGLPERCLEEPEPTAEVPKKEEPNGDDAKGGG